MSDDGDRRDAGDAPLLPPPSSAPFGLPAPPPGGPDQAQLPAQPAGFVLPPWSPPITSKPSTWRAGAAIPLRPLRVGETLDAGIRIYRMHWKTFMGIVAAVVVPFTILQSTVLQLVGQPEKFQAVQGTFTFPSAALVCIPTNANSSDVAVLLFLLVDVLFVRPLLSAALVGAVADTYAGRVPSIAGSYRMARSKLWSVLLVEILVFLCVLGGLFLIVVGAIIFAVKLTFATPAVVLEDVRGRKALSRSWRLTDGGWWRIFGTILLAGLLVGIVSGLVSTPLTLLANSMACSSGWIVRMIASIATGVVFQPFTATIPVLLYFDARVRKEGLDLAIMAQELQAGGW